MLAQLLIDTNWVYKIEVDRRCEDSKKVEERRRERVSMQLESLTTSELVLHSEESLMLIEEDLNRSG